jgi:hypothetical protein
MSQKLILELLLSQVIFWFIGPELLPDHFKHLFKYEFITLFWSQGFRLNISHHFIKLFSQSERVELLRQAEVVLSNNKRPQNSILILTQ